MIDERYYRQGAVLQKTEVSVDMDWSAAGSFLMFVLDLKEEVPGACLAEIVDVDAGVIVRVEMSSQIRGYPGGIGYSSVDSELT